MRSLALFGIALGLLAAAPLVGPLLDLFGQAWGEEPELLLASGARLEGDPASDEETQVEAEAAGETASLQLRETPAGLIDPLPGSQTVREASPLGPIEADMRLQAGPVVLEQAGSLSPAFDLRARVTVDGEDRFDEAWLRLDDEPWARFEQAGNEDGHGVLLADLGAGSLVAGQTTHVDVLFERRLGPDVVQHLEGPGWEVHADAQGPPAPELVVGEEGLRVEGQAERFEVQKRSEQGDWQAATVENGTLAGTREEDVEMRARGVDELGNVGPWSAIVHVPYATEPTPSSEPWRLVSPEPGARVEGPVDVHWRPSEGVLVEVQVRSDEGVGWQLVDRAQEPPIRWRTGFVADGAWEMHVRALQDGNWTSRLLALTVDNLEQASPPEPADRDEQAPTSPLTPRAGSPWSAALATGAGLLAIAGLAGRAWTRRPK